MDIMNVGSALSAVNDITNPASLMSAVSIEMLDNTLEANDALNASMIKMMENSVSPHLGGNIDLSI